MDKRFKRSSKDITVPEMPQQPDIFDEQGNPDVRKMSGNQVLGLLHLAGIKVPPPMTTGPK